MTNELKNKDKIKNMYGVDNQVIWLTIESCKGNIDSFFYSIVQLC